VDCVALEIDATTKQLIQTKPVYGGNARAIYTMETMPQMATVRSKAMTALAADASRKGEIVTVPAGLDPAAIKTPSCRKSSRKWKASNWKTRRSSSPVAGYRRTGKGLKNWMLSPKCSRERWAPAVRPVTRLGVGHHFRSGLTG